MTNLTPRQAKVLAFIRDFIGARGFPPTHAEIAAGLGFRSANAAAQHVRLMARKGALAIEPGIARGIRLADEPPGMDGLPLIGEVAAGQPILAEENVERIVAVPPRLFRPAAQYLLRVRGESMIEAAILPGDLVAVHRTATVNTGQIAVVRLDDEVTVKRWRTRRNRIVLEPANAAMEPIVVDPRRTAIAVEGCVVGLIRGELG